MGYLTKTSIYLKGKIFTTSFNSLSLYQEIGDHHHLEIAFRMDLFDERMAKIGETNTSIFGERISIEIADIDQNSGGKKLQFIGIVTQLKKSRNHLGGNNDEIILVANSPTIVADNGPNYRSFVNKTASDIAKTVLSEYSQLKTKIYNSKFVLPYSAQNNESAFDYVCRLAAQHGEWFYYDGEKVIFGDGTPLPTVDLDFGIDLKEFNIRMLPQPKNFSFKSYNAAKNEYSEAVPNGSKSILKSKIEEGKTNVLLNTATGSVENLQELANTQYNSLCGNEIRFSGISDNPNISLGCIIKPKGSDKGNYRVIKVTHSCSEIGNYENRFEAVPEIDNKYPNPYTNIRANPETQNQIGIVVQTHDDPEGLGRIKVELPYQQQGSEAVWVRMLAQYAGADRGIFFLPEVGDEVLVGFEGGNAEHPYVLGSLYNGKTTPPFNADEENTLKGIVTNSKLSVIFDDVKKIVTIETPGGNKFVLNDDERCILVNDLNGNEFTMGEEGIVFDSQKDIILRAQGNINIDSSTNLAMKASADASLDGTNISQKANAQFTAEGNASAELKSSGQTTVKGSMVMIN